MTSFDRFVAGAVALAALGAVFVGAMTIHALARDTGQWAQLQTSPQEHAWIVRQKQPDTQISCCGPGDMYYADIIRIRHDPDGDHVFAIITDDRDDLERGRPHRDLGTAFEIPTRKYNDGRSDPNPTGHGVLFLNIDGAVLCYFAPGGV